MSDLPEQGLFQQLNARPVSGEHLEVLGKRASAMWHAGSTSTLSDAVIEVVKHAGLSPEQVKRVIEFTNTDAFQTEFKKEGSHRVVNFEGGPADPSYILKDLNDGGGGSVFDRGTGDYRQPPRVKTAEQMDKTASAGEYELLAQAFGASAAQYPEVNPYREVEDLQAKLASQFDNVTSELSGLETMHADLVDRIYSGVKQAALSGYSLGEVVQVWSTAVPSQDHVKLAFQLIVPRLLREQVFSSQQDLANSIEKVGGAKMVNPNHPMLQDFQEYCDVLNKLAELRQEQKELHSGVVELRNFMKTAGPNVEVAENAVKGIVPRVFGAAKRYSEPAGNAVRTVAKHIVGDGEGAELAGTVAQKAVQYSPHAAALVGANEIRRQLKYSPAWNKFQSVANPQSDQYKQREYELAAQGQMGGGYIQ